ncbi:RNA-binding protein 45-like [Plodia interpunctella]|uniref:RNA-binding protein 45-like n=1 Tax=Plodia interpunctella TaxID=58824 RepID=UPI002368CABB|nr:RNA-binding protein 45-like [Plodia interpunctella]
MDNRRKFNKSDDSSDVPMYSRLFIVTEKQTTEQQFIDAFKKFGQIEDVHIPRDHNSGERKGFVYIKFSKASEAAAALEEMNFQTIPNTNRPLKVMVAANRSDIQTANDDDEKFKRIFITVPKMMAESKIKEDFSKFGNVQSVLIQKDRDTGMPRGFAYVKFNSFLEAAQAVEGCDTSYRAIFALPKVHKRNRYESSFESNMSTLANTSANFHSSLVSAITAHPEGYTRINFMCPPYLTHYNVESLFDIVPGMIDCKYFVDYMRDCGKGTVTYSNPMSAAHAVQKLNRFEYPPGVKIFVRRDNSQFEAHEQSFKNIPNVVKDLKQAISSNANSSAPDLAQLAEAIAEASKLIKMATSGTPEMDIPDSNDLSYCSVKLPPQKPLADIDSPLAKRCFLVCKPQPPPMTVLRDIFCRFGDLINVYTLPNKTVGYARYASAEAADEAIKTLHGAEICGIRMKVLEADDEAPPKRSRYN